MLKKWSVLIFMLLTFMIILFFIGLKMPERGSKTKESVGNMPEGERRALAFILEKNSGPELSIFTNYLDNERDSSTVATGQDVLSESQGLFLLYWVNRDKKESFDLCLDWTVRNLYLSNGTFSWVKTESLETRDINAFIDDLRIVRALMLAHEKWKGKKYLEHIEKTSEALLTFNVNEDIPCDFYDIGHKVKSKTMTISYLDLDTMKRLISVDLGWKKAYENALSIAKNSKIAQTGLYEFQYDLEQKKYRKAPEISLIQSVYTMIHLAEIGQGDREGLDWLYGEYEKHGKIFTSYSYETHEPTSDVESTALYALTAQLFYLEGEYPKAKKMLTECEKFQIRSSDSEINGSFGNEANKEVYSFDNLQYILASSMITSEE